MQHRPLTKSIRLPFRREVEKVSDDERQARVIVYPPKNEGTHHRSEVAEGQKVVRVQGAPLERESLIPR